MSVCEWEREVMRENEERKRVRERERAREPEIKKMPLHRCRSSFNKLVRF